MAESERRLIAECGDDSDPRVAALRAAHARELELIVDEDGWPTLQEAGPEGTMAALALALGATPRAAFMRRCLTLMKSAVNRGDLPAEQPAMLEARLNGL